MQGGAGFLPPTILGLPADVPLDRGIAGLRGLISAGRRGRHGQELH